MTKTPRKLHFYEAESEKGMPTGTLNDYMAQGLRGAMCGYMRHTTLDREEVTCAICRRKLLQQ